MLHFLRTYMPNHAKIIRSVSLILHARSGLLRRWDHLQNITSNMDRQSLVPALDLLAQLPNLQDFEILLESRADRQIIADRLNLMLRRSDLEVDKIFNAANNAVSKSTNPDAVWIYWPPSPERGPRPDVPELSTGQSDRSHMKTWTQTFREFLEPMLVRRNRLVRIHDENAAEMEAHGEFKTRLTLMGEADDVNDIVVALTKCMSVYEEWKQESRHGEARPDRVQRMCYMIINDDWRWWA